MSWYAGRRLWLVLSLLVLLTASSAAAATPGELDPSFGTGGIFTLDLGFGGDDYATAAALAPDGKVVVVGQSTEESAIVRFDADGTLDPSFSDDGRLREPDGWEATAVAVQPDGRVLVAGGRFVARYDVDGTPDDSFSGDGRQELELTRIGAIALQSDGRILVAGSADGADASDFAIARLTSDGALDADWDGDGMRTTDFAGGDDGATSIAVASDGAVVAAGVADESSDPESFQSDIAVARYHADGSPDTAFSGDGKLLTRLVDGGADATDLVLQPDGKVVVAGRTFPWVGTWELAVLRYNADGTPDAGFADDGVRRMDLGADASTSAQAIVLQPDGKLIVGGNTSSPLDQDDFALVRLDANGMPDASFSDDGVATVHPGTSYEYLTDLLLRADGRPLAVGYADDDFAVVRFDADGALDASFQTGGVARADFPGVETGSDVLVQPDGRLVTIGTAGGYEMSSVLLTRHEPNGALDDSFAGDGVQTTSFDDRSRAFAGVLQPDGRIVVVGEADPANAANAWLVARYDADGALDAAFSGDGQERIGFGFGSFSRATDVALLSNGKLLVVGTTDSGDYTDGIGIVRLNADGTPDTSLSGDGRMTTEMDDDFQAPRIAPLPDGRFAIATIGAGSTPGGGNAHGLQVSVFEADGTPAADFGDDGRQTLDFGDFESVAGLAVQPDGKLVAAVGTFRLDGPYPVGVARFEPDGSLDESFSGDGRQTIDLSYNYDNGGDLLLRGDGRIVLALKQGLAQLDADGSLDTAFSGDGLAAAPVYLDSLGRAALASDGKIVEVGTLNDDLALLRFDGGSPASDTIPPDTSISAGPSGEIADAAPTFAFAADEAGASFECRVDGASFVACTSPHAIAPVGEGTHVFAVRAIDLAGNVDPSPATRTFTVRLPARGPTATTPAPTFSPPAGGGPGKPAAGDVTPAIHALRLARGHTLRFQLTRAARVTVTVVRLGAGVRHGRRCVAVGPRASGRRCDLVVLRQTSDAASGQQTIVLRKRLAPGRYRLTLVAREDGAVSRPVTLRLRMRA